MVIQKLLQIILEVLGYLAEEVVAGVAAVDAVIAVRINQFAEVFIGLHKGFGVFGSVAEVDVVVGKAVNEKQFATQLRGTTDGTDIIT